MPVAAGTVVNMFVVAVVALFDDTAQQGCPAGFDGLHETMLMQGQSVGLPVGWTVDAKNVGHLQRWLGHAQALALAEFLRPLGLGFPRLSSGLRTLAVAVGETAI
jgi:hypothetical protein